jgi:hypothetical protein
MKTDRGVYLDINESEYVVNKLKHLFYFSSVLYMNKFKNNVDKYIKNESMKFYNRYKIDVDLVIPLAIAYYKQIEKRGYRVISKEVKEGK